MFTQGNSEITKLSQYPKRKRDIALATQQVLKYLQQGNQGSQQLLRASKNDEVIITQKNNDSYTYVKTINKGQVNRVQLLPYSQEFYKLQQLRQSNYKMIVTNIRGGQFTVYIGFDKKYPSQQNHNHLFRINKQTILCLKNKKLNQVEQIYFGIYSKANLLMFNFRIQVEENRMATYTNFKEDEQVTVGLFQSIKSMVLINPKKRSRNKSESHVSKNKQTIKKLSPDYRQVEMLHKKKLLDQRTQTARLKKQAIEIYKIKDRRLKFLASSCKKLVECYEKQSSQDEIVKRNMNRQFCKAIYCLKILKVFNIAVINRQNGMKNAQKAVNMVRKAKDQLISNMKQAEQLIQSQKHRNLMGINLISSFISKLISKQSEDKAPPIVAFVAINARVPCLINKIFDAASQYRRACRLIQRYWKNKFQSRTEALRKYAVKQGEKFIKSVPKFKALEDTFKSTNICYKLALQYQYEEAGKVNSYVQAHKTKMEQIKGIIKMNEQIRKFNQFALKKRQKKYLDVPPIPSKPQHRFFRNVENLKSFVRAWLEVQYRKQFKRLKSL